MYLLGPEPELGSTLGAGDGGVEGVGCQLRCISACTLLSAQKIYFPRVSIFSHDAETSVHFSVTLTYGNELFTCSSAAVSLMINSSFH